MWQIKFADKQFVKNGGGAPLRVKIEKNVSLRKKINFPIVAFGMFYYKCMCIISK